MSRKTHYIVPFTAEQFRAVRSALWQRAEMLRCYAMEIGDFDTSGRRDQLLVLRAATAGASKAITAAETPECDCGSNSARECAKDWHGHCEACNDTGILLMNEDGSNLDVQKCDDCNRYDEDGEALEALNKLLYGGSR